MIITVGLIGEISEEQYRPGRSRVYESSGCFSSSECTWTTQYDRQEITIKMLYCLRFVECRECVGVGLRLVDNGSQSNHSLVNRSEGTSSRNGQSKERRIFPVPQELLLQVKRPQAQFNCREVINSGRGYCW